MKKNDIELVALSDLRVGMYVELDVGWMSHPFPTGSFRISSAKQIETLRGLGLLHIRVSVSKSDSLPAAGTPGLADAQATTAPQTKNPEISDTQKAQRQQRMDLLSLQQRSLLMCERRFGDSVRQYRKTLDGIQSQPKVVGQQCVAMIDALVKDVMAEGESAIRLLTEAAGDKSSMHPVNVSVVSLLLGRSMGLAHADLVDLGLAAFLHDVGKVELPDRVRCYENTFSAAESRLYQDHVQIGVQLAKKMALSPTVLQTIAQHHEFADGSGFPTQVKAEAMGRNSAILALVNRYDNLCNPSRPSSAMTPHEALSLIFTQLKSRFDPATLSAFIRMMGVYPPGSVVQLVDERYALVVSVNSTRPLKPRVLVHESGVPKDEALILDLELAPNLGIRRSLKPANLPSMALEYLSPRQRICYFFEPSAQATMREACA